MCGGKRTTFRDRFSPFITWALGMELRCQAELCKHLYRQSPHWPLASVEPTLCVFLRKAEPQYLLEGCIMSELGFIYVSVYVSIHI